MRAIGQQREQQKKEERAHDQAGWGNSALVSIQCFFSTLALWLGPTARTHMCTISSQRHIVTCVCVSMQRMAHDMCNVASHGVTWKTCDLQLRYATPKLRYVAKQHHARYGYNSCEASGETVSNWEYVVCWHVKHASISCSRCMMCDMSLAHVRFVRTRTRSTRT